MHLSCSPMQQADMDPVFAIERICFAEPWSKAMLEEELLLGHRRTMALRRAYGLQSGIIGYLFFHLVADEMHVLKIAVLPEYRRCGGAARLMRAGMSTAIGYGVIKAILEVRASNAAAISFYKNLGFEKIGCRLSYYNYPHAEDAIIMRKNLKRREQWL